MRGRWWPFAAPAVFVVFGLYVLPLIMNAVLAFTDWSGFKSDIAFTGGDNLRTLMSQYSLGHEVRLTVVYAITASLVSNGLSLPLALALERPTRGQRRLPRHLLPARAALAARRRLRVGGDR